MAKNLVVKVTGDAVTVYRTYPEGVVYPKAYTSLDAKASAKVRNVLNPLRTAQLAKHGRTKIGKNSKEGIKPELRAIVSEYRAGTKQVQAPEKAEPKQVQNKAPKGIPTTKAGTPDKRYKAAKQAIPAAKQEGESFDYAAMAAYADAIEKLVGAGFSKDEAKTMAAAIR